MATDLKAQDILNSLFRYFRAYRGYKYQLANAYVFKWESDFFCIASSGYSYEVEIKVSRSDFFADFKKEQKHQILAADGPSAVKVGKAYAAAQVIKNGVKCREIIYSPFYNKRTRQVRKNKYPLRTNIKIIDKKDLAPNKFCFAVPEGLVKKEEIPEYAGLIYTYPDRRRKPRIIKRPPPLHKHKRDFTRILLKKYYWAYLNSLDRTDVGKNFDFPNEDVS